MPSNLKLVIVYDARNNVYTVSDHNLTAEEAEGQVAEWRQKSLNALTGRSTQQTHNARSTALQDVPARCRPRFGPYPQTAFREEA